jgi:hypothetical protein
MARVANSGFGWGAAGVGVLFLFVGAGLTAHYLGMPEGTGLIRTLDMLGDALKSLVVGLTTGATASTVYHFVFER